MIGERVTDPIAKKTANQADRADVDEASSSHVESSEGPRPSRVGPWATHIALVIVQLAFGSQAVEGKLAMMQREAGGAGLAPEAIAMARMMGAAVFFQLAFGLCGRPARRGQACQPGRPRLVARDHASLFGLSILGITVNQTLFLLGLQRTTPISAALLCVTIPVFTAALAVLARHERPSARLGLGLTLALGGAAYLTVFGSGPRATVAGVDRGAVLVLLNSLSYAAYLVFGRHVIRRLGTLTVVRWIFTWGALSFLPLGLGPLWAAIAELTPFGAWMLAYLIVVPTILAYLANAWALGRSTATLVTIYIYLQPLIAASLAYVQLGQAMTIHAIFAGALILGGVTVVATRASKIARAK